MNQTEKKALEALAKTMFPLQTVQSLSERWGVTPEAVNTWRKRHTNFPKEIHGIVAQTKGSRRLFPLYEVRRYEQERGLNVKEGKDND